MIQIYADGELTYDSRLEEYDLLGLKITSGLNKGGTAEIIMPASHPAYSAYTAYRTIVEIYRNGELRFRGRVLYPEDDFTNNRTVICEGELCFLRDGISRPYGYADTLPTVFAAVVGEYNAQVEPFKQFKVGTVEGDGADTYISMASEDAETVLDTINNMIELCGGYITFTTDATGARVINWVGAMGSTEPPEPPVKPATEGLEYTKALDGEYYICSDIGTATDKDIVIAATYGDLPVAQIGVLAFLASPIESVEIPENVEIISQYAFKDCKSLKVATISDSVTEIRAYAFYECANLESVEIPENVEIIDSYAFGGCTSLKVATIPDQVKIVAIGTFRGCTSLESVGIGASVSEIAVSAFLGCTSLESVDIGASVSKIAVSAFEGCTSLKDVYYRGTEAQWQAITISVGNDSLKTATIHYNYKG